MIGLLSQLAAARSGRTTAGRWPASCSRSIDGLKAGFLPAFSFVKVFFSDGRGRRRPAVGQDPDPVCS